MIYIPDRGDIVWLNFSQNSGHEQGGRRPALVVSPKVYNLKSELALVCPITSHIKNYPFEIACDNKMIKGVILVDQVRSVDWKERKAKKITAVSDAIMREVRVYLEKLIAE